MLRVLRRGAVSFETFTGAPGWTLPPDAVWIDLLDPTPQEDRAVEGALNIQLITREDMAASEPSSRLYQENGATFITAFVLINSDSERPDTAPVSFVLTADKLVTLRYGEPRAFKIFAAKAERQPHLCATAVTTFLNLLDAIVDRTADVLERIDDEVDRISLSIFKQPSTGEYQTCLYRLGRAQTTNAEIRRSMASLARATSFATLAPAIERDREALDHLNTLNRDADSLNQQSDAVANNVGFLLNAALGFINLEQANTGRIFSIVSVLFLPATLVASIYGMNFEFMPELGWRYGYPYALGLMAALVVGSLLWFKRKRWL